MDGSFFHGKIALDSIKLPSLELKTSVRAHKLSDIIVEKLSEIKDIKNFKLNTQLTLYLMNIVEVLLKKQHTMVGFQKASAIDKKELVVSVLTALCELNEDEQNVVREQVQTLFENGALKGVSTVSIICRQISAFFFDRFTR